MKFSVSKLSNPAPNTTFSYQPNKGYSKIYDPFSLGQTEYVYPFAFDQDKAMLELAKKARRTVEQLKENIREIIFFKKSPEGTFNMPTDFTNFGCRIGRIPTMLVQNGEILPTCYADCKELITNLQQEEVRALKWAHAPQDQFDKDAADDAKFLDTLEQYHEQIKDDYYLA